MLATSLPIMGQRPNVETIDRSSARQGMGFETGDRHRAAMSDEHEMRAMPGPLPPEVAAASSPFHSMAGSTPELPRRNPKLTLGVIGGLLAIVALTIGMLFSSTSFVDREDVPIPKSTLVAE